MAFNDQGVSDLTGARNDEHGLNYSSAGVDTRAQEQGMVGLLRWVGQTHQFREGLLGQSQIDIGHFANVIDVGNGNGIAITTDGVGSKILVSQMVERYDTVGIDCVAMNANDLICVGAEPLSMVDCISIGDADPDLLEQIGKGLYEGARQANISIVGGEIAQVRDMIRGHDGHPGFELTGTCVGTVSLDRMILGDKIEEGDLIVGFRSAGIHSNGLTLARKALIEQGEYPLDQVIPELGRTLGDEILEPTRIYVKEVLSLLEQGIEVKGLAHITGDGLLNLRRLDADMGYVIDDLPDPHPIFNMIRESGEVGFEEMFRVFNMGIGFCVVVSPDHADDTIHIAGEYGTDASVIGHTVPDPDRTIRLTQFGLVSSGNSFVLA